MLKKYSNVGLSMAVVLIVASARAEVMKITFDELPGLVSERNEHSRGAKNLAEAANERTGYLVRSYLPSVTAKAGRENFKTGDLEQRSEPYGGVEARLNIFNSGRDHVEDQIRREEYHAADASAVAVMREELAKARKIYWQLVSQKEVIWLYETALQDNEKNLAAANNRIKAGIASETDRIEFEMAQVEIAQDLARARLQKQNFDRDLKALLALNETIEVETTAIVDHQHEDDILKSSLDVTRNPSIRTEQVETRISELKTSQFRREWLPSIDVVGSRSLHTFREREFEKQDDRWESVVGIELTMPLFDGWKSQNEVAAQRLRTEGLQKQNRQSMNEMKSAFEGARASLELNHQLIHNSEQVIEKGRKYMSRTLDEYRRGAKNSIDVLNASQRFFDIQKRYADLKKDYQVARADLLMLLAK